jgi:hypothetical protein
MIEDIVLYIGHLVVFVFALLDVTIVINSFLGRESAGTAND